MSDEQLLTNDAVQLASSIRSADQLPFYQRPRPNAYRFERDDFENIPVVQHRFKPRPPYVPPPTQVSEGGQAQHAGIQLGDAIVRIGDQDTEGMSLSEAQQRIDGAAGELKLAVKSDADDGTESGGTTGGEAQEVSLGRRPQAVLSADRGKCGEDDEEAEQLVCCGANTQDPNTAGYLGSKNDENQ